MLHEVLLSLSGFPSPLFDSGSKAGLTKDFPLLSPPEVALLTSIGELARVHRELRDHLVNITSSHRSTICRAVASSISSVQLARFQQKILDVENSILKKDASTVAAYDIVPLAGVVGEFDGWKRRMNWLWDVARYMQTPSSGSKVPSNHCTGAEAIDRLRKDSHTGYPDIEAIAIELGQVAETAWLRQLSSWMLYGNLPSLGPSDFCVQVVQGDDGTQFTLDKQRLPKFVSADTADSIIFVGRFLNQIRTRGLAAKKSSGDHIPSGLELLPIHLKHLTSITFPITSAGLSSSISAIRASLSQNTLQLLLPLPKIMEILTLFYDFFLLGRGEFAGILIEAADKRLGSTRSKSGQGVQGIVLKDTDLSGILANSFSTLSALSSEEHDEADSHDAVLELARSSIQLRVDKSVHRSKEHTIFNDLLLSSPTMLTIKIAPPMDLFLSPKDLSAYSSINAYLLSIERAHMHLTSLWRLTTMRRDHPCPAGPPVSATPRGRTMLKRRRERTNKRGRRMRKFWATMGKAAYFLTEIIMHLEGTVIKGAWHELCTLLAGNPQDRPKSAGSVASAALESGDNLRSAKQVERSPLAESSHSHLSIRTRPGTFEETTSPPARDPSSLALLHQVYLASLSDALLLTNVTFTKELKLLLTGIENLVAQMKRLETAQVNLDLEEDDGVIDGLNDWAKEEQRILLELDRARKKVDEGLRACMDVLSQLDSGKSSLLLPTSGNSSSHASSRAGKHPDWNWRAPGLDRLLMKLEFANVEGSDSDGERSP